MRQIVLLHGGALGAELVQHRLHIHRVPDDHCIRYQVEAQLLVRLGFLLFAADDPFMGFPQSWSNKQRFVVSVVVWSLLPEST